MTGALYLLAAVGFLLLIAVITALIDRWSRPASERETGDDCRQIDIVKRGDVVPFRRAE